MFSKMGNNVSVYDPCDIMFLQNTVMVNDALAIKEHFQHTFPFEQSA